ncbi:ABC transporter substrate-binding protein [uncultured Mailhella sp.]|uniref:ABC transporter substrate-binding protein n=1 Tax=uncultured Mailhella sp. TaxID=1981031 RepID=UPI0025F59DA0|nr:ABC transporter substrate-binding protein [uncultured Mailhella sp.]
MPMLKRALCALMLLAVVFSQKTTLAADALKIGSLPAADSLILHAAKKDGVFAAHGLDVEIVPFQSALELGAAMRAGSLDGHFGDIINVLMQNENGAPQVIVATTSHSSPNARFFGLAVRPDSPARTLADLKGKPCSIGRATIVDFVLDSLLEQEGATGSLDKRDIRQIPVRLQMLLSGRIESALLPEPLLSLVEGQGARVLLDDRKLSLPLAVIALKKPGKNDEAFTGLIRRFRAALAEEAARINADPDVYKDMMQKLGLLSGKAAEHYVMLRFEEPLTPLGLPSEEDIRHYADWMKQNRLLKKDVPALADIVFQDVK